jgi:hypothetical protein
MTTRANFYVDQGTDFVTSLELETSEGTEYPVANNDFFCQVRKLYSTKVVIEAEINVITNNGVSNELILEISSEKTKDLEPGKYQYDILMKNLQQNEVTKILEGLMFVIPSVTKIEEV